MMLLLLVVMLMVNVLAMNRINKIKWLVDRTVGTWN